MTTRCLRARRAILAVVVMATACLDVADVELIQISGTGAILGGVYLDLDGTGTLTAGDDPITDATVVLRTTGTADLVAMASTDSLGGFELLDVPVGTYALSLDSSVVGDSLSLLTTSSVFTIPLGDTLLVSLGATFPFLPLEDVPSATVGDRVFTAGIAMNTRTNFGDGQVHFRGTSGHLRALNVERGPLTPGDSARLLGRVITDNGRPALSDVTFFVLEPQAQLVVPTEATTAAAANAGGGTLDAALVRIRRAEITDTSTVGGHFRVLVDDGTDSVEVVIRDFLVPTINTAVFRPDTIVRIQEASGLLSPFDDGSGTVRWRLLPRAGTDLVLETKVADLGVTTGFNVAQADPGDTVRITVAVSNAGPLQATGSRVRDTIPSGLAFVSAVTTAGSYDRATGIWDLGTLAPGARDTLRIDVQVTTTVESILTNVAQVLPLTLEADPNTGNNVAFANLRVPPP